MMFIDQKLRENPASTQSSELLTFPLESLLSARQLIEATLHDDNIYFMSNLSGSYSLYEMSIGGSIPIPLLPEGSSLQNPHLSLGKSFILAPKLGKIIISMDYNGDELYQVCEIPISGGIPQPMFGEKYKGMQVNLWQFDYNRNILYITIDDRKSPGHELVKVNLETLEEVSYGKTPYGKFPIGQNSEHTQILWGEQYGHADIAINHETDGKATLLLGKPLSDRNPNDEVKRNATENCYFVEDDEILLFSSVLFSDKGSCCWMEINTPQEVNELRVTGLQLPDAYLEEFKPISETQFSLKYNVDGCTYFYLAKYHSGENRYLEITHQIIGNDNGPLVNGMALSISYDQLKAKGDLIVTKFIVSYTKATSPSQLYLIDISENIPKYTKISNERVVGIPEDLLSEGEDASFVSFDGLRISARLYRPSEKLGYDGPRPLIVYIHGGPQSQERPDFTWFSMPLIQYLTLNGFTVFVPNVRGSTGYGYEYMSKVERDWGGDDVKDHLEGLKHLENDPLIDSSNRGVTGRSYGGYMTLTLISKYPNLFKAGIDLFGPHDLLKMYERLPPSWQALIFALVGDPVNDREYFEERSPSTYFHQITAPLLVIQGANDPRVVREESEEIVEKLKNRGNMAELLIFEDEGHDVMKFKNKMTCYTKMTEFFKAHLMQ